MARAGFLSNASAGPPRQWCRMSASASLGEGDLEHCRWTRRRRFTKR